MSTVGRNWGDAVIDGSTLVFNVDGKPAFRFPLSDVGQVRLLTPASPVHGNCTRHGAALRCQQDEAGALHECMTLMARSLQKLARRGGTATALICKPTCSCCCLTSGRCWLLPPAAACHFIPLCCIWLAVVADGLQGPCAGACSRFAEDTHLPRTCRGSASLSNPLQACHRQIFRRLRRCRLQKGRKDLTQELPVDKFWS